MNKITFYILSEKGLLIAGLFLGFLLAICSGKNLEAISNLTGAAIGALGAFIVATYAISEERRARENEIYIQARDALESLLLSLRTEILMLESIYKDLVHESIKELINDKSSQIEFAITHDYFTIYHANAHRLGDIRDEVLRADIINLYTRLKQALEMTSLYNKYGMRRDELVMKQEQVSSTQLELKGIIKKQIEEQDIELDRIIKIMKGDDGKTMDLLGKVPKNIESYIRFIAYKELQRSKSYLES